jgi:uncharacterized integral membrane protein
MTTKQPPDSSKRKKNWVDAAGAAEGESAESSRVRIRWQWVVGALIALALLDLIVQNGDRTQIDFLFFDFSSHLWLILLLTAVGGAVAWEGIKHAVQRRRRQRASSN